jgi:hypothetical protein
VDLADFWPPEIIKTEMEKAGFSAVAIELQRLRFAQDLRAWFDEVSRRYSCSQLTAISDATYEAGVNRLVEELAERDRPLLRENHLCLVTIRGVRCRGAS